MITTEIQYRATVNHLRRFEDALRNLETRHLSGKRTKRAQLEVEAVRAQADDLRAEIDRIQPSSAAGDIRILQGGWLSDLAALLVKARIARRWTQRQLADALGVAEQQVQRYEATGYGRQAWPASAMSPTR